jgi:hypothetical protein
MTTINLTLVNELRQQLAGQRATRRWLEGQRGYVDGVADKIRGLDAAIDVTAADLRAAERGVERA